tara:strand:+ start:2010 stop:2528 length:519 start_codon:yes stop_codon:yes gene_type:complete
MKNLYLFFGLLSFSLFSQHSIYDLSVSSYSNLSVSSYNVMYDVEDNLIFFNGSWSQSWGDGWNGDKDDKPYNQNLAMSAYHLSGNRLILQSNNFEILNVIPLNFLGTWSLEYFNNGRNVIISYPSFSQHIDFFEVFNLRVVLLKRSCYCSVAYGLAHSHIPEGSYSFNYGKY